jgi:hypothetical protein
MMQLYIIYANLQQNRERTMKEIFEALAADAPAFDNLPDLHDELTKITGDRWESVAPRDGKKRARAGFLLDNPTQAQRLRVLEKSILDRCPRLYSDQIYHTVSLGAGVSAVFARIGKYASVTIEARKSQQTLDILNDSLKERFTKKIYHPALSWWKDAVKHAGP